MKHFQLAALVLLFFVQSVHGQNVFSAKPEEYINPQKSSIQQQSLKLPIEEVGSTVQIRLEPVGVEKIKALKDSNSRKDRKLLQIGFGRPLPDTARAAISSAALIWTQLPDGGQVARFSMTSPQAAALRLGLVISAMEDGVELRFFGSADVARIYGPFTNRDIRMQGPVYWTPVIDGETLTTEIYIPPGLAPNSFIFDLPEISHLVSTASRASIKSSGIGSSAFCEHDVACISSPTQAFLNAAKAVAKMVFNDGSGSYVCTGTLLNDTVTTTYVPYFYTANHCISTQSAASTLNTYWFFESATCGGSSAPNYVQRSGGATLLHNNPALDSALLRLNESPPSGVIFAGWDASAVPTGTNVTALHHPSGDLKKVSLGSVTGYGTFEGQGSFIQSVWSYGSTEGGSSGSGLFTYNGSYYSLRGGLYGGSASCDNTGGIDSYSRLDLAYPAIVSYLNPASTSVSPQTGWWWNPSESGRGFTIEVRGNNLFMAGYLYAADTGQATWFVSGGSMSNSSTYQGTMTTYGHGQTLTGAYIAPAPTANIGTIALKFTDATHGTITWPGGTIPIERFNIVANGVNAPRATFQPETGWWWNANENGRGFALEIQNGVMFLAGYMYDSTGNPIWYSSANQMSSQSLYQGSWMQYANGQTLTGAYRAPVVVNSNLGPLQIQFQTTTSGTLTLPDGRAIPITRFSF